VPYILAWYPYSIIVLIQVFDKAEQLAIILSTYFAYTPYLHSLLLPYSCILFVPEAKRTVFNFFGLIRREQTRVGPVTKARTTGTVRTLE
jgi:hypothetical protein